MIVGASLYRIVPFADTWQKAPYDLLGEKEGLALDSGVPGRREKDYLAACRSLRIAD
jgi:hypothetical protein